MHAQDIRTLTSKHHLLKDSASDWGTLLRAWYDQENYADQVQCLFDEQVAHQLIHLLREDSLPLLVSPHEVVFDKWGMNNSQLNLDPTYH